MKKVLIIALFVLGIYNVSTFGMTQEIILTESFSIIPLDDPADEVGGGRPDPTLIYASIDGNQLSVGADTDAPAYVEIINQETDEMVVEEEFIEETTMSIPEEGNYEVYIYTESGTVFVGEFSVE